MHSDEDLQAIKGVLSLELLTLAAYLQTWQQNLRLLKTVLVSFHLNNREAGHELNVTLDRKNDCPSPRYQHTSV